MVFKKFLAKLGKGSAQVDLILDQQDYRVGEEINGELRIQGGTVEQQINKIEIAFYMNVRTGEQEQTILIQRFPILESFTIRPSENKTFPFTYKLPENLLLSGNSVSYYFITNLEIAAGVDSTDRDLINILPPMRFQKILSAFEELGFYEKYGSRSFNGYLQEFEFVPTSDDSSEIKEIDFAAAVEEQGIRLLLEIDTPSRFGEKEVSREVWIGNDLLDNPPQLVSYLRQVIAEMLQSPGNDSCNKTDFYSKVGGMPGAIGAFAIGLITAELFDEMTEMAMEDGIDESSDEGFWGDLFDAFGE